MIPQGVSSLFLRLSTKKYGANLVTPKNRVVFAAFLSLHILFQQGRPVFAGLEDGNYNEYERSGIHLGDRSWMEYEYKGNESIWKNARTLDRAYVPCAEARDPSVVAASAVPSRGLLIIEPDGGLCQIKWAIMDAVALARVLNATLLIPELQPHQAWGDNSTFGEIYSLKTFETVLKDDIRIQRSLTDHQEHLRNVHKSQIQVDIPGQHRKGSAFFRDALLPTLDAYGMVTVRFYRQFVPEEDDIYLQRLRCRANYHALRFKARMRKLGREAIQQLRGPEGQGKFVAVHFRFEPDWLAYQGCLYSKEANDAIKQWAKDHGDFPYQVTPESSASFRKRGLCPVTPLDLAIMLKGLGVGADAKIYMGGGIPSGGMKTMAPLLEAFPGAVFTKDMLVGEADLESLKPFSMRMASLDYLIVVESDVAVLTSSGNFAAMVDGHRYYQSGGTKETLVMRSGALYNEFAQVPLNMDQVHKQMQQFRHRSTSDPRDRRGPHEEFYARPRECIKNIDGDDKPVGESKSDNRGR